MPCRAQQRRCLWPARTKVIAAGLVMCLVILRSLGCTTERDWRETSAHDAVVRTVIGHTVLGRDIECVTISDIDRNSIDESKNDALTVMFIASIHGDEPAGTPLLQRLKRDATALPPWMHNRTLVIIAQANPDGLAANRRGNARGVDLNRNFPAQSFTHRARHGAYPLSEPESRALHRGLLKYRPQRIVSLHQPIACIDYDGDAGILAHRMSESIEPEYRLPVKRLGAYPGSLGACAGEDLGIPVITIELPADAHLLHEDELWRRYGVMLIEAIR